MFNFGSVTLWYVLAGTVLAAVSASSVGSLTLLQKKPLAGDAIAHALLPGLCIGFLVIGKKSLFALLVGAFIAGIVAFWAIDEIPKRSKVKKDTATALILSLFFGIGLLFLTHIQHSGNAQQVGLQHFLFGNAASIQVHDVMIFTGIAVGLLISLMLFLRGFKMLIFDKGFASTIGWPIKRLDLLLRVLVVIAVVVGIQSVGLVLMTAMLVAPAAAARFWTDRLDRMLWVSALFAATSAVIGTLLSYQVARLPTGPCIVLMMAVVAMISFLGAPKRGLIAKLWAQYYYRKKVVRENLLKLLYTLDQEEGNTLGARSLDSLLTHYPLRKRKMASKLQELVNEGLVRYVRRQRWSLTEKGKQEGKKILRLHILWEAYLVRYLRIAPDHVHEDAESIEHLLTPRLCAELERLVGEDLMHNSPNGADTRIER